MEKINTPFKIVLTGPESSGKTTLAKSLAHVLQTTLVPEFSRPYLESLGRPYIYNDLKSIGLGQQCWEDWYMLHSTNSCVVCDTDWTVIRIWELFQYGTIQATQFKLLSPNTHYFLCAPDIPWVADDLRESPSDRDTLFVLYEQLLREHQAAFTILRGDPPHRLKTALAIIQNLY